MYVCGLDLGQARDYTALAIAQRHEGTPAGARYDLVHLERFPLGTAYPAIVESVVERMHHLALRARSAPCSLVLDATGVGRPVVDLFRRERLPFPMVDVTITGGDTAAKEGSSWRVPKRELVSVVQVLLQSGRLKIAGALPEAATLTRELLAFQVKIDTNTAHDSYGAWREGTHDDLVLAVALACWAGQTIRPPSIRLISEATPW